MAWIPRPYGKHRIFFDPHDPIKKAAYDKYRLKDFVIIDGSRYMVYLKRKGFVYFVFWMEGEEVIAEAFNQFIQQRNDELGQMIDKAIASGETLRATLAKAN
jgi:hypothetical protein